MRKITIQNRKLRYWSCLWLVACGLWLVACKQEGRAESRESSFINVGVLTQRSNHYAVSIARIMAKQKLSPDDISKIDFSLPGSKSYIKKPEMNIYAPEGGGMGELNYDSLKPVANTQEFIINLGNRVMGVGTEKTELLAILPDVKDFACKSIHRELERKGLSSAIIPEVGVLNLSTDLTEIAENEVVTLPSFAHPNKGNQLGCVKMADKYYYYHILLER